MYSIETKVLLPMFSQEAHLVQLNIKTRFLQGFSIALAEGFFVRAEHIPQALSAYAGTLLLLHFLIMASAPLT